MRLIIFCFSLAFSCSILAQVTECDWVAGSGDTLFYGSDSLIQIALITDIGNPEYYNEIALDKSAAAIRYHQSKLYVLYSSSIFTGYEWGILYSGIDSIEVYNVSELANPILQNVHQFPGTISQVQFSGDYLITLDSLGMKIMSVLEDQQLVEIGSYSPSERPIGISVDGLTACITSGSWMRSSLITLVNISDPESPVPMGEPYMFFDSIGCGISQPYLDDNILVTSAYTQGNSWPAVQIFDANDPEGLDHMYGLETGWFGSEFHSPTAAFLGNAIYVSDGLSYTIFDRTLTDSDSARRVFDEMQMGLPQPFFLNHYGFVPIIDHGLCVFEASDPFNPIWLGVFGSNQLDLRELQTPSTPTLLQNYPNPFNPSTIISYDLSAESEVKLTVYDISGRTITALTNTQQPAGSYSVRWNGKDGSGRPVSTGIYFACFQAGDYSKTIKMVYLE